jgi:nicotinamide phosphoribosyltransferase
MMLDNPILATDSYKLGHWNQYPANTTGVYSYLEARQGSEYDETVFFGLQSILKTIPRVTYENLSEAFELARVHFGDASVFNYKGWETIIDRHGGRLPLHIKAVPEGSVVPVGNVLMAVENTDPDAFWLTNALESLLMHVWYPTTVATRSRSVKRMLAERLTAAGSGLDGLQFMLHDFGYRGAAGHEAAAIAVAGHLTSFVGADTLPALLLAIRDYGADPNTLAFSVPATEHSVMTSLGRDGEAAITSRLLDNHPGGILSVVADSYDIYEFVDRVGTTFKDRILSRDGVFVVRPDSVTRDHPTPQLLTSALLERLWSYYGGTQTPKGFRVLDPHVRLLWGDGIDEHGIEKIVNRAMLQGFSPENLVFGMGGGLLQRLNRDTCRFAFKSSAQQRDGEWHDVYKKPLDSTKASKKGRLTLIQNLQHNTFHTDREGVWLDNDECDALQTVFKDGQLVNEQTFDQIRERAAL